MSNSSELLTYQDVAKQLTMSVRQVKRLKAAKPPNGLRHVQIGVRAVRFRQKDVDSFVSRRAGDRQFSNL